MISYRINKIELKLEVSKRRYFNAERIECFKSLLTNETWSNVYETPCVKKKFEFFLATFMRMFESAFPLKTIKQKNKPISNPWITTELIEEGRLLKQIHFLCKSSNDLNLRTKYNILKKKHESNINACKKITMIISLEKLTIELRQLGKSLEKIRMLMLSNLFLQF